MTREGKVYCDSPKCGEEINPNDIGHLHYGKVDYHAGCYVAYLREKGAIIPRITERRA